MSQLDRKLKIGIELHRVLSAEKLFCNCVFKKNNKDSEELSSFEIEYPKEKKVYNYNHADLLYCRYEKDQGPPRLNKKIFNKAIKVVKQIPNISVPKKVLFNRKHIKDGSIPKGYQISGVVGYKGQLILKNNKIVPISRVYLEEDSCTYVYSEGKKIYNTSRCGLPLLEVVTEPVILNAEETKQLIALIEYYISGHQNLYKSSFSIRQDINISSIDQETKKIEFKGVDKVSYVDNLFSLCDEFFLNKYQGLTLNVDGLTNNVVVLRGSQGADRMYPETDLLLEPVFYKKQSFLWSKYPILKELHLELKNVLKNKGHLKRLIHWLKNKSLTKKDLYHFITLAPILKKKIFSTFEKYLEEECSLEGLKKGQKIKPYSSEFLKRQLTLMTQKEFYEKFKYYIPRSFKP